MTEDEVEKCDSCYCIVSVLTLLHLFVYSTLLVSLPFTQTIGPALVQVAAPSFSGYIAVSVREQGGLMYLVGTWSTSGFSANDLRDDLIYDYSYAVGK